MTCSQVPILILSDDEDDGIAFVGSTHPKVTVVPSARLGQARPSSKQDSINLLDSDSEDGAEALPLLEDLFPTSTGNVVNQVRQRSTKVKIVNSAINDSEAFSGVEDDEDMVIEVASVPVSVDNPSTDAHLGTLRKQKRPLNDPFVNEDNKSSRLSKEEKAKLKETEKRERENLRAQAKAEKEAAKSFQKKVADVNRLRTSKSETIREIRLYLSADLASPSSPIAGALPEIRSRLEESLSKLEFLAPDDTSLPGIIRIQRYVKARWDTLAKRFSPLEEPYWEWDNTVLCLVNAEEVVNKISLGPNELCDWMNQARDQLGMASSDQMVLIIKGLAKYHSQVKTLANRKFTAAARAGLIDSAAVEADAGRVAEVRMDKELILRELTHLQIRYRAFIVHVERTEEIEDWIWNLCADVALRPYKLLSKSHLSFASGERGRKSSSMTDALELMLQEVQGVTQSAASGIAAEYSTFSDLMSAFEDAERTGGVAEGEELLANCEVRNLKNGTASGRRLNKALAKRVYHVFRGEDSLALA